MPLTSNVIHLVRYPPERLVDAEVNNITGGGAMYPPPLYLDELQSVGKMVKLDSLATSQNANVTANVIADGTSWPATSQAATSELNNNVADEWGIDATDTIQLTIQSAANVTNYILSYGLWVWQATVADKILNNIALTSDDQALLSLLPKGWVPRITPYKLIQEMYKGQKFPMSGVVPNVTATGQSVIAAEQPPNGYFDVILEIGVDASAAGNYTLAQQLTNGLQVFIERDIDKPLQSYQAAGYPWRTAYNADTGLWMPGAAKPFIVARTSWRVYVMTVAGQTAQNIPYRVVAMRCPEFDVHRAHWGITGPAQDIINQVKAGVL